MCTFSAKTVKMRKERRSKKERKRIELDPKVTEGRRRQKIEEGRKKLEEG
jgi:hypothetical protein